MSKLIRIYILSNAFFITTFDIVNVIAKVLLNKCTVHFFNEFLQIPRDDYSVGFLIDNSLIGYMIFNMGWVHVRYEVDTTGVRTYIKYGSNEWWRFS